MEIKIKASIEKANNRLNSKIKKFAKLLDYQMIELKYGINYREEFLTNILSQIEKL